MYAKVFPNCGPWWFTVPCTHLLPSACWPTRWSTLFPHRMMGILFSDTSWPSNKYIWSLDRKITSELAHVYALDPVSDWGEGPLAGHVVKQHHAVRPPAVRVFNLDINVHIHNVWRRRLLSCTQKINYDDIIVVNIISKSKLIGELYLKYVLVTERNLSWPAVSHSWMAMLRSSTRIVFTCHWSITLRHNAELWLVNHLEVHAQCGAEVGHEDPLGDPVDEGGLAHGCVPRKHNLAQIDFRYRL